MNGEGKSSVEVCRGNQLESDGCRIQIMAIYGGISLKLHMYENIFVNQSDSALCQFMITTTVTRGVADGDG